MEKAPLLQRIGLKYYSFLILQVSFLAIMLATHNIQLATSFVTFMIVGNNLLAIKDFENTKYSQELNKSKWFIGPLITSCLTKPMILYVLWGNYEILFPKDYLSILLALLSIGYLLSGTIDAIHELLHRPEFLCRMTAYLTLIPYQFTVYPIEHLYLHHKKVGTPEDPICSPKDQSFYAFFFKALFSAYKFNWQYNTRIFISCLTATLSYNALLFYCAFSQGGQRWLEKYFFFSLLSYSSLFFMEGIQYIEHYGLIYRKKENSEKIKEICSWNAGENGFLNWMIFRFQRHSDHHMNAYKVYPTLDLTQNMPVLPFDFTVAVMMAMFPSIWTSLMNPLVDEVLQGKKVEEQHRMTIKIVTRTFQVLIVLPFLVHLFLAVR